MGLHYPDTLGLPCQNRVSSISHHPYALNPKPYTLNPTLGMVQ